MHHQIARKFIGELQLHGKQVVAEVCLNGMTPPLRGPTPKMFSILKVDYALCDESSDGLQFPENEALALSELVVGFRSPS